MTSTLFGRPGADEYAPYYDKYVSLVTTDDLVGYAREQLAQVRSLLGSISEEKARFAYAAGKWTIKEVLGHITDTERVFQYRAMSIARGDATPLPGFDQDVWNPNGGFNAVPFSNLVEEWVFVREAFVRFLDHMPVEARMRRGTASGNPCSARALAYIPPGHTEYHVRILKEKYLA